MLLYSSFVDGTNKINGRHCAGALLFLFFHSIFSILFLVENTTKLDFDRAASFCVGQLNIYFINFDKSTKRLKQLESDIAYMCRDHGSINFFLRGVHAFSSSDVESMLSGGTFVLNEDEIITRSNSGIIRSSIFYRHSLHEAASTLSHLKAIQLAYENGYDSALILEDDAIMTEEFLRNWRAYLQHAPKNWNILQWETSNAAIYRKKVHEYNDFWLSWSGQHWSTTAYTIRRGGMERVLNRTSNFFSRKKGDTIKWVIDEHYMLVSDEVIYIMAGNAYTSSRRWIISSTDENVSHGRSLVHLGQFEDASTFDVFQSLERPESIAVVQNIRMRSIGEIQKEVRSIDSDIRALAQFNPHSQWFVRVVLTSYHHLSVFYELVAQIPGDYVQFQVEVLKERFNKFAHLYEKLDAISLYDFVLLKDNDIRLSGFEWNAFMRANVNSIISAPYRIDVEGLTIRQNKKILESINSTNYTVGLQDGAIFNTPRDTGKTVSSNPVMALEMFMVLMIADFAVWFFRQILTNDFLSQNVSWGPDLMWCSAAHDYGAKVKSSEGKTLTPCSLVSVNVIHTDTRQIAKSKDFVSRGNKVLNSFRKNSKTRRWIMINSSFRYHYHALSNWCKNNSKKWPIVECLKDFQQKKIERYLSDAVSE